MRIVILTSSFLPTVGGLQYELKWFLDNLDRRLGTDESIEAYFVYPNERSEFYTRFANIMACDLKLENLGKVAVARMVMRLGAFLRQTNPEVVHCHGLLPDGLWVLAACRVFRVQTKIVVTSHGQDIVSLPQWAYGVRTGLARSLGSYVAKRVDMHVLPSEAMIKHSTGFGVAKGKTAVIPNGIPLEDDLDFEKEKLLVPGTSRYREVDLSGSDGINILSLSGGRAIKNVDALVEAFSRIRSRMGSSKMLLACHGASAERIVRLVSEKGLEQHVLFTGEITGPVKEKYFRASQIYCNVSHFENFPLSLLEAMKYGSAVLASRVGGVPEFIKHEENGLLVSPTDVDDIASCLIRLYGDEDLRRRLVENGLQAVERYAISRVVDQYMGLYEGIGRRTAG